MTYLISSLRESCKYGKHLSASKLCHISHRKLHEWHDFCQNMKQGFQERKSRHLIGASYDRGTWHFAGETDCNKIKWLAAYVSRRIHPILCLTRLLAQFLCSFTGPLSLNYNFSLQPFHSSLHEQPGRLSRIYLNEWQGILLAPIIHWFILLNCWTAFVEPLCGIIVLHSLDEMHYSFFSVHGFQNVSCFRPPCDKRADLLSIGSESWPFPGSFLSWLVLGVWTSELFWSYKCYGSECKLVFWPISYGCISLVFGTNWSQFPKHLPFWDVQLSSLYKQSSPLV